MHALLHCVFYFGKKLMLYILCFQSCDELIHSNDLIILNAKNLASPFLSIFILDQNALLQISI